jgi:hypothetical protein
LAWVELLFNVAYVTRKFDIELAEDRYAFPFAFKRIARAFYIQL